MNLNWSVHQYSRFSSAFHQNTLMALAKAVANATATLVLKAKTVATTVDDVGQQNMVVNSATQCAFATSQLVACTKVITKCCTKST